MRSATEPFARLSKRHEYRQLVKILRSDNPLIALAVAKREVSWTKFQQWLLDPSRHPPGLGTCFVDALLHNVSERIAQVDRRDRVGQEHLVTLQQLVGRGELAILTVNAEVTEGAAGRSDLVVECEIGGTYLEILIENKIESKERRDQLADYVDKRLATLPRGGVLVPILMELGDDPVGSSSCPWAICLQRADVVTWLKDASHRCKQAGLNVPALVGHYLRLFESWDLAFALRRDARGLIEKIERSRKHPSEWELVVDWLAVGDRSFFEEVLRDQRLKAALKAHGFDHTSTAGSILGRNEILTITKKSWTLPPRGPNGERVNLHFESRRRGELRLDIEILPYESGVGKKPGRMKALKHLLELKARLIGAVRSAVTAIDNPNCCLGITTKQLRKPNAPDTCGAVKFDVGLGVDCAPDEHAMLAAAVVRRVTPVVDSIVAEQDSDG